MTTPTYLLVPGAWHGAWCWQRLGEMMDEHGLEWAALDLPSSGGDPSIDMMSDVEVVRRAAMDRGPVVLVAHSYAGAVVTEAQAHLANLSGIVFLAALVPRLGQNASDVTREYALRSPLDETIRREEGLLYLDPEPAALALYGDCDAVTRSWAIGQVTPQTLASFRSPRTSQSIDVATTYVICERDQALLPEVQEQIAERCDDVVTLDSDHSPFLSRPREFADLLASLGFGA